MIKNTPLAKRLKLDLYFTLIFIFFSLFSLAQNTTYVDEDGAVMAFEDYILLQQSTDLLTREIAPNTFQVIKRERNGRLTAPELVYLELQGVSGKMLERDDVLFIVYQNTGDKYFESMSDRRIKSYFKGYQKMLEKLDCHYFFICPNKDALGRLADHADWIEDPDGFFRRNFFKLPTEFPSFIAIGPYGRYVAYLDEHPDDYVKAAIEIVKEK